MKSRLKAGQRVRRAMASNYRENRAKRGAFANDNLGKWVLATGCLCYREGHPVEVQVWRATTYPSKRAANLAWGRMADNYILNRGVRLRATRVEDVTSEGNRMSDVAIGRIEGRREH